jgi:hypothetical protein
MRAVAGSVRWRPERTHPGRLVGHAIVVDRASGCASGVRTASRSSCAHVATAQSPRCQRTTGQTYINGAEVEHTLPGERAICELVAVHFGSQVHKTPHGKQIHERAGRDEGGSQTRARTRGAERRRTVAAGGAGPRKSQSAPPRTRILSTRCRCESRRETFALPPDSPAGQPLALF